MHRTDPYFKKYAPAASKDAKYLDGQAAGNKQEEFWRETPFLPTVSQTSPLYSPATNSLHDVRATTASSFLDRADSMSTLQANAGSAKVMDPLALLRLCIRYISSHPEVYGSNLRLLLDNEVVHTMRLKASEAALTGAEQETARFTTDTGARTSFLMRASTLPPLDNASREQRNRLTPRSRGEASASQYRASSRARTTRSSKRSPKDNFGFDAISFAPSTPGFLSLLNKTVSGEVAADDGDEEEDRFGVKFNNISCEGSARSAEMRNQFVSDSASSNRHLSLVKGQDSGSCRTQDQEKTSTLVCLPRASGTPQVVIDGNGYEVTYLRNQLQQMEAMFNGKCIRFHEIQEENKQLVAQLENMSSSVSKQHAAMHKLQLQLDSTKRELDAVKDKASPSADDTAAAKAASSRNLKAHRSTGTTSVAKDAKAELMKLTQLWRETERALQESRRAFENAQTAANQTLDHLSDAFHYIERLERRVARRDRFIQCAARRQASLEEKYEKLMWCFTELGTMTGIYSYADHLLADHPVWSLLLFVRLQRHVGDSVPAVLAPGNMAACGSLTFNRSPCGGKLADEAYDLSLLRRFVEKEVGSGPIKRTSLRRLRTNLHGTVACRVLRWSNPFIVDYLGGDGGMRSADALDQRRLPLLTMASLLLPQPLALSSEPRLTDSVKEEAASTTTTEDFTNRVPNSTLYDQTTIRFILRCFWLRRLEQFRIEMLRRSESAARRYEQKQSSQQRDKADDNSTEDLSRRNSGNFNEPDVPSAGEDAEDESVSNTFLGALVAFALELLGPARKNVSPVPDEADAREPQIAVRGVFLPNEIDLYADGRIFFARLMHANDRRPRDASEADAATASRPPELNDQIRELLCALYYYTMEYKERDADFRLFYLVSHQRIPEIVGVNFYAGIDALQQDCYGALRAALDSASSPASVSPSSQEASVRRQGSPLTTSSTDSADAKMKESSVTGPLDALRTVAELIDTAPLVNEGKIIEEDSDGEGYGSVLADSSGFGSSRHRPAVAPQPSMTNGDPQPPTHGGPRGEASSSPDGAVESLAPPPLSEQSSSATQLMHNLWEYIEAQRAAKIGTAASSTAAAPAAGTAEHADKLSDAMPAAWDSLDHQIGSVLGPHASLLKAYRDAARDSHADVPSMVTERLKRRELYSGRTQFLAAARGSLPVDAVLDILGRHCFATYAVSVCGVPRFALCSTLLPPATGATGCRLRLYDIVGRVPPTAVHLRRLRMALALDQPGALIQVKRLFEFDAQTATPSHFYDELLTLTLDIFLQEQSLLMHTVLSACAARHERYAAEGAEECDGNVPLSSLKLGITRVFERFAISKTQSLAFVHHLLDYDKLLRHEDEVRHEQFTDAPFLIHSSVTSAEQQAEDMAEEWSLEAEAETCSLLHLALAIRSTYIVWGPAAAVSARQLCATAAIQPVASDATQLEDDEAVLASRPRAAVHAAGTDAHSTAEELARAEEASFEQETRRAYRLSLHLFMHDNSGPVNPLRRTAMHAANVSKAATPRPQNTLAFVAGSPKSSPCSPHLEQAPTEHNTSSEVKEPMYQAFLQQFVVTPSDGEGGTGANLTTNAKGKTLRGAASSHANRGSPDVSLIKATDHARGSLCSSSVENLLSLLPLVGLTSFAPNSTLSVNEKKKKKGAGTRAQGGDLRSALPVLSHAYSVGTLRSIHNRLLPFLKLSPSSLDDLGAEGGEHVASARRTRGNSFVNIASSDLSVAAVPATGDSAVGTQRVQRSSSRVVGFAHENSSRKRSERHSSFLSRNQTSQVDHDNVNKRNGAVPLVPDDPSNVSAYPEYKTEMKASEVTINKASGPSSPSKNNTAAQGVDEQVTTSEQPKTDFSKIHRETDGTQWNGLQSSHRARIDLLADTEGTSSCSRISRVWKSAIKTMLMSRIFFHLTYADFRARMVSYGLSFCSVFFVVMLCVSMLSVLSSLPVVFLRLGEADAGEVDLVLRPGGKMVDATTLNYTAVAASLRDAPASYQLHIPRITWDAEVLPMRECTGAASANDLWYAPQYVGAPDAIKHWCTEGCLSAWCGTVNGPKAAVIAFNASWENHIGLGTKFPYPTPKAGEAIVSEDVASTLGLSAGDFIVVFADVFHVLREAFLSLPKKSRYGRSLLQLKVVAITDVYPQKFGDLTSFVLIGYEATLSMLAASLAPTVSESDRRSVARFDPRYCATSVSFRMPVADRQEVYVKTKFAEIKAGVMAWGQPIIWRLGYDQLDAVTPLLSFLKTLEFFSTFVGLIMSMILVALAFLSVVLIYSLLTVGIETRTFELGIQRMIGFTRENLVAMVLTNAYFFTIPAWLAGLVAGQVVYSILRLILKETVDITMRSLVSGASIGWGTLAGLLIPLVASIAPIFDLVTLTLSDALSTSRGRVGGVIYKIERGDSPRMARTIFGLGLLLAIFGFLLYYMFPLSLVTVNLPLMFYIFFGLLMGMLGGLVLLMTNLENVVEAIVLNVFFFWERVPVFRMVTKSLAAHRVRNRKTTLMYALSLGFIIFISVAFQVQVSSMIYSIRRNFGGEVLVTFGSYGRKLENGALDFSEVGLASKSTLGTNALSMVNRKQMIYLEDFAELEDYLGNEIRSGAVEKMSYRMHTLHSAALWLVNDAALMTPGRYRTTSRSISAIPPGFYDVLFPEFLLVSKPSKAAEDYGLSDALYTVDGYSRALIATSLYRYFAFNGLSDIGVLRVQRWTNMSSDAMWSTATRYLMRPSSVLDSSPSFLMTKFPNSLGDVVVSLPTLARFSSIEHASCLALSIQDIFVRVPKIQDVANVKLKIHRFFSSKGVFPHVNDLESALEDVYTANRILSAFFVFAQVMILVICFFSLMSSMTTNVLGSSKEIAILLCLGMTHMQIYRVYVEEAFVLVVSSGLLGVMVGIAVAYTMQLQNILFSQLPLEFHFPFVQLIIVIVMGFAAAVAASCSPVAYLLRFPSITHILRRVLF